MSSESTHETIPVRRRSVSLRLPSGEPRLDQDQEWCEIGTDDGWRRIRFHDYGDIYRVPGLYETLFYDHLHCCSPSRVVGLLADVLSDFPETPADLRVLDLGAGNGMVGEELRRIGIDATIGADIIPEARAAALRDRPGVYDDYIIGDLMLLRPEQEQRVRRWQPNCLTSVAALGFGDIPAEVFIRACNLVDTPAWLAFNIKESFLDPRSDPSGLAAPLHRMQEQGLIEMQAYRRYPHRMSVSGEPLFYVAMVARKLQPIPLSLARV
ncbi:MAG: methyltransferase [Vicinamibacterales bacterium]